MATYFSHTILSSVLTMLIVSLALLRPAVHAIDASAVNLQIPTVLINANLTDKAKNLFKAKCRKVAGNDRGTEAFASLEKGISTAIGCVTEIGNMTAIQMEFESARIEGGLESVTNKYCKKRPEAGGCLQNLVSKFEPCLQQDERNNTDVLKRIFESPFNFVCHKGGGDKIALFIAEGGPECLESKKEHIQRCMNTTFGEYVPKESFENMETLPKFIIGTKQCEDIQKLSDCVYAELKTCENLTPANIVRAMFRFIEKETICQKSNAASLALPGMLTTSIMAVALLLAALITNLRI